MRRLVVCFCACVVAAAAAGAGQDTPLPEREPFLAAVRENLARSQREQWRYGYKERRTELRTNPFGKIGTDGTVVYEVSPGPEPGITFRRLIERNGKPVVGGAIERQDRRGRSPNRDMLTDVVDTLAFDVEKREVASGHESIVVGFRAWANARPKTREGKIAKVFEGRIWVAEPEREVTAVEATALDDMSFGFGLIARLNEGTKARLVRERVADGLWLPTSLRLSGEGRALLFRKLTVDFAIDWFDYKEEARTP